MQHFPRTMESISAVASICSGLVEVTATYMWIRIEVLLATGPVNSHVYEWYSSQHAVQY